MMRRRPALVARLVALVAALAAMACTQKELCDDHWTHAPRYSVDFKTDWALAWEYTGPDGPDWAARWPSAGFGMTYQSLLPAVPSGIKVEVYNDGHDNSTFNIPAAGGVVEMTPGQHQILLYNNDTEFIVFNDINSSIEASATTRSRSRASYIGNSTLGPHQRENTVNPPDFLFGHYIEDCTVLRSHDPQALSATMKPLVFRYLVIYEFTSGVQYVGLARGALSGMAGTVFLTDGHTGTEEVTVLYDCVVAGGRVEAVVNSFGVPDYPNAEYSRNNRRYGLNLEVRLTNGHMINFDFDVTDQIAAQPRGGVIRVGDIVIPDEVGKEDTGSFDVTVDGWGDYEDIAVDLGKGTRK